MLQYLVILLDDIATSYCYYENNKTKSQLMSIENLRAGILFGMKENLMINIVYPNYELPQEYSDVIETIDHCNIMPVAREDADVIVINNWKEIADCTFRVRKNYVLRISKLDLFEKRVLIKELLGKVARLNVIITDIETFSNADFDTYKTCLDEWSHELVRLYTLGSSPQFNLITDRLGLNKMNNCGAGDTTITLAPDGCFYVCPAFYHDSPCDGTEESLGDVCTKRYNIGSLKDGLNIRNPQLYGLSHAPLCRKCDAYHCKRCVWLNRRTTFEVNIPGHEQCVVAHLERNASRDLLVSIQKRGKIFPRIEIKEIDYLDPFDVRER